MIYIANIFPKLSFIFVSAKCLKCLCKHFQLLRSRMYLLCGFWVLCQRLSKLLSHHFFWYLCGFVLCLFKSIIYLRIYSEVDVRDEHNLIFFQMCMLFPNPLRGKSIFFHLSGMPPLS